MTEKSGKCYTEIPVCCKKTDPRNIRNGEGGCRNGIPFLQPPSRTEKPAGYSSSNSTFEKPPSSCRSVTGHRSLM